MSLSKTLPAADESHSPREEDEEDVFIRESRELSTEFVRLLLGDKKNGVVTKGPGDQAAVQTQSRGSATAHPSSTRYYEVALKLRDIGDETDTAYLQQQIMRVLTPTLRKISAIRITGAIFRSMCNTVLVSLRSQLTNGWKQVSAVYQVMNVAVQELRCQTPPGPRNVALIDREQLLQGFPGDYMREVGLETWVHEHGGLSSVPDPGSIDSDLTCVDIPDTGTPV